MRMGSDLPPRRARRREPGSGRGRIVLIALAVVLVVLFLSARAIAGFYTDYLWFDSLGFSGVFTGVLGAKLALAAIFTGGFALLCLANLWIADRLAPKGRVPGPDEEFLRRYQELVGRRVWLVRIGVSLLFGLIAGAGVSGRWKEWILFTHAQDFGMDDPQFGLDIGFYMFRLPFWSFLVSWLFAAFVIIFVITAVAHYLNGGIRLPTVGRATPQVKAHLSVLLGVLALIRAAGYWLDRFELNMSTRGAADGAGYTDVKAQLPALNLLVLISLAAFVLLIVNIWRRGFTLPVLAVGLWAVVAVVAGTAYPALVERFQVQPAGATKELPYIERNIKFTRIGLDLDVQTLPVATPAGDEDPSDRPATSSEATEVGATARALDPQTEGLKEAFRLSGTGQFLTIGNLDLDSYEIGGQQVPVLITVRELSPAGISRRTWANEHLAYTHGEGVVIARADRVTDVGRPVFVEPGSQGVPELGRPEIYVSENLDGYAIVGTTAELSPRSDIEEKSPYEGTGGVELNSRIRRAAFALRFNEWNLFGSNRIESDSRIVFHRRLSDRVREVAPFLSFDSNPYPVISEGRVKWVVDAYTTSANQPYGERVNTNELPNGSGLRGHTFNYVRNSAKAVVDAYDGSVVLYVTDDQDPLLKAWRSAFGDLFADVSEAPADLREHFRYPADLFQIQSTAWGRYQLSNPGSFYEQLLSWKVAPTSDAVIEAPATGTTLGTNSQRPTTDANPMKPQQTVLITGENERSFVQVRPYVRFNEDRKITGFITGVVDDQGQGQLVVQLVSPDSADAPRVASNTAETDAELSEFTTNNSLGDATLLRGEVQLIPYRDTVLWVRNYFVQGEGGGVPQLKKVAVTLNDRVFVGDTLSQALSEALAADVPDAALPDEDPDPAPPADEPDADLNTAELLAEADLLYGEANEALRAGDLATYQERIDAAFELVRRAAELSGATTPPPDDDEQAPATTEPQQTTTTLSA